MQLNVLSTKLLAEAIKNSLLPSSLKNRYKLVYDGNLDIADLSIHLSDMGVHISQSVSKTSKIIFIADSRLSIENLKIKPALYVLISNHDSIVSLYPLRDALNLSKTLESGLVLHEFIGKPEIEKKNLSTAAASSLLMSGRLTSKIHVSIYNPAVPVEAKYVSKSTYKKRASRLSRKAWNVFSYRYQGIKGKITYSPLIQKAYISWAEHTAFRNISAKLPSGKSDAHTIAIAMAWFDSGGVERVMLNLIKDLNLLGYEVHIITTIPGEHPWDNLFGEVSKSVVHLPEMLGKYQYTSMAEHVFAQWLKKTDAQTLLITNSLTAYRALPTVKKDTSSDVKIFDVLHTYGTPHDDDAFLKLSMPYIEHIDRRVVIDEFLKRYYIDNYPVDPLSINVIYNGLDESIKKTKVNVAKSSSLDGNTHIAYMGRLDPDKSPLRLVEIARYLQEKNINNVVVDVHGDGSLMKKMRNLAASYALDEDTLRFHGRSHQALIDIAKADFSILVSDNEGIPMSILESMHVGTPCIAPAVGGIPEMIDDDKDGFLIHYDDASEQSRLESIFRSIDKVLLKSKSKVSMNKLSDSAKTKVETKFGHMAKEYDELIKDLHEKTIN